MIGVQPRDGVKKYDRFCKNVWILVFYYLQQFCLNCCKVC